MLSRSNMIWLGSVLCVFCACGTVVPPNATADDAAGAAAQDAMAIEDADDDAQNGDQTLASENDGPDTVDPLDQTTNDQVAFSDLTAVPDVAPTQSDAMDAAGDAKAEFDAISCKPGSQKCAGTKLATCGPMGDGYSISNCFPGMACLGQNCAPIGTNLIIAFDTSGSMATAVTKKGTTQNLCATGYTTWPKCEYDKAVYPDGCTRMGVSKSVFQKALAKLDEQVTHLALFRFPQKSKAAVNPSCSDGYNIGDMAMTGDPNKDIEVVASTAWYWNNLAEILCVPFPKSIAAKTKENIATWMNGTETPPGGSDPELRANGGTPIGKTLYYIGEYLRNVVIIDGKACTNDSDCANVNYACKAGKCFDAARACRDTVVVLFTDGGESNSADFFGPWTQAKRISIGLGCDVDADCANGATCQQMKTCGSGGTVGIGCADDADCGPGGACSTAAKQCLLPKPLKGNGYYCDDAKAAPADKDKPCLPGADPVAQKDLYCKGKCRQATFYCSTDGQLCDPYLLPGAEQYCAGVCAPDPRPLIAIKSQQNVLKSPDGKPFGVRLFVVDIGSTTKSDIANSLKLAVSGNGKVLGADASDPEAFLGVLDTAFDLKNKKICGELF